MHDINEMRYGQHLPHAVDINNANAIHITYIIRRYVFTVDSKCVDKIKILLQ